MTTYVQADRPLTVSTPLGQDDLLLVGLTGHEAISQLFQFTLELIAENTTNIRFEDLLGQKIGAHLTLLNGKQRHFSGICKSVGQGFRDHVFTTYRMEVVPQLWLLSRRAQSRIFQHATVPDILRQVLAGLDVLSSAKGKLRGSPHIQVLVELAVVRLARLEELLSVTGLVQQLSSMPRTGSSDDSKKNSLVAPEQSPSGLAHQHTGSNGVTRSATSLSFVEVWDEVLKKLGPMSSGNLRLAGEPAILGPNTLAIRYPASYSQAYAFASADATLEPLRSALKAVTGVEWQVRVEQAATVGVNGANPEPSTPPAATRGKDFQQYPLLRRIGEVLGGQLVRAEEGFHPAAVPASPAKPPAKADDDADSPPEPDET